MKHVFVHKPINKLEMDTIIFKTSAQNKYDLLSIKPVMDLIFGKNWSYKLDGVDRIVKVMSSIPCAALVKEIFRDKGIQCDELNHA
jgi:hypothetical protein